MGNQAAADELRQAFEDAIDNRRFDSDFPKINFSDIQKIVGYILPEHQNQLRKVLENIRHQSLQMGVDPICFKLTLEAAIKQIGENDES